MPRPTSLKPPGATRMHVIRNCLVYAALFGACLAAWAALIAGITQALHH